MLGYVWINTRRETEGAKIYVDDVFVGKAKRVPYHDPYGVTPDIEHIIRLEYPGYHDYITTFSIPTILSGGVYQPHPGGHRVTATMVRTDDPILIPDVPVSEDDKYLALPLFEGSEKAIVGVLYRVGTTGTYYSKLTPKQAEEVEKGEAPAIDYIQQNIDDYAAKQKTAIPVDSGTTGKTLLLVGGLALLGLLLSKK